MLPLRDTKRLNVKNACIEQVAKRSRTETSVQIRKQKRETRIRLRRQNGPSLPSDSLANQLDTTLSLSGPMNSINPSICCFQTFLELSTRNSVTIEQLHEHVQKIRRMALVEEDSASVLKQLIDFGVLYYLNQILEATLNGPILFEASWAITNIASTYAGAVMQSGAVCNLIKLLQHEAPNVREQAVWGIANVAGDSNDYREWLLTQKELVPAIVYNLEHPHNQSLMLNMAWAAANLLRGDIRTSKEAASQLAEPITKLLVRGIGRAVPAKDMIDFIDCFEKVTSTGDEAVTVVTNLKVNVSDHPSDRMLDAPTALVLALERYPEEYALLHLALSSLVNIAAGTDEQTQLLIKAGFLKQANRLLANMYKGGQGSKKERNICAKVLFCLSNIAAGTEQQISSIVRHHELFTRVANMACGGPFKTVKEALFVLANIVNKGKKVHKNLVADRYGIPAFCYYLQQGNAETDLVREILEALDNLLKADATDELGYKDIVAESKGIEILEQLQQHPDQKVYEAAVRILELHFDASEDEDPRIAPTVRTEDKTFEFGMAELPPKQLFRY